MEYLQVILLEGANKLKVQDLIATSPILLMKPMQGDIEAHKERRRAFWSFKKLCEGKEEREIISWKSKNCFYSKITKTSFEENF